MFYGIWLNYAANGILFLKFPGKWLKGVIRIKKIKQEIPKIKNLPKKVFAIKLEDAYCRVMESRLGKVSFGHLLVSFFGIVSW